MAEFKTYPENFGLIPDIRHDDLKKKDYRLGSLSGIGNTDILQLDGHGWKPYLPPLELQYGFGFDTWGCVTFSAWNCLETLIRRKFGIEINKSDRFTAKMSGTQPGYGNSCFNVAESIRKLNGGVDEAIWPFARTDANFGVKDYYADIPDTVKAQGLLLFKQFLIKWEWVPLNAANMMFALQYAPLQVTGFAWEQSGSDGLYHATLKTPNHAFELYDYVLNQEWDIYDQYDNDYKRLSWDYVFGGALKFDVSLVPQVNLTFLNQLLNNGVKYIQRVGAHGEVYRLDPTLLTFLDSNKGADNHIPLVDEVLKIMSADKRLIGISEADYTKLITP